ncbi:hypothetical protein AAF712_002551 [Marasmius tenuissimus]|uniref:Uncharacterized protein n=1 Tax=Marasmius tenuissimus TaxID=585030 RepID=A0ABR3A8Z8_9AGAR
MATGIPDDCLNLLRGDRGSNSPPKTLDNTAQTPTGGPDTPPKTNTPLNSPATSPTSITSTTSTTHTASGDQVGTSTTPPQSSTSNSTPASASALTTPLTPSTPSSSTNGGESTNENFGGTLAANVPTASSGQTDVPPNTHDPHQQGSLTSTSGGPSATPPSGTPPVTHKTNVGTIIGAILGALLLLILVLVVILCYRRRRKHRQDKWWKPAEGRITFFKDKMVNRPDEESEKEKARGDDRGLFGYSVFASKTARQKETDGMSSVDSFASDLPLSTAYTSTISDYESDSTSTFTMGLSEASTDVKGNGYTGARTERQMEIEGKIFELQREIIGLRAAGADATDVMRLRERIERLRDVQGETWAMEVTDKVPIEMAH